MKLDSRELDIPPAPDTVVVRLARWACMGVWLIASATLLACVFPPHGSTASPEAWFAAVLGVISATALSTLVLQLCDMRDAGYWTDARIRQRKYPIWLLAFGLRHRGRRP